MTRQHAVFVAQLFPSSPIGDLVSQISPGPISTLLFFLLLSSVSFSQNVTISGKITDRGTPLPFATIFVKGTSISTNGNSNGEYILKLPAGKYEFVFQYIGYAPYN